MNREQCVCCKEMMLEEELNEDMICVYCWGG